MNFKTTEIVHFSFAPGRTRGALRQLTALLRGLGYASIKIARDHPARHLISIYGQTDGSVPPLPQRAQIGAIHGILGHSVEIAFYRLYSPAKKRTRSLSQVMSDLNLWFPN